MVFCELETSTTKTMIQGVSVRLIFASQQNGEVAGRVREILKDSYLYRQYAVKGGN